MILTSQNEQLPLGGRTFLVTRTSGGSKKERELLESMGAKVIELPTIEIFPPSSWKALDEAIDVIDSFDWIVFTSPNGVRSFFGRLERTSGGKKLRSKFACVGPSTAAELRLHGFVATFVPGEFLTEKLGEELSQKFSLRGKRILLARAEVSNGDIRRPLDEAGAILTEAPAYKTLRAKRNQKFKLTKDLTDITLTSPSTVEGLVDFIEPREISSRNIRIHCIGPITSKKASGLGLIVASTANVHTIEGLLMHIVADARRVSS